MAAGYVSYEALLDPAILASVLDPTILASVLGVVCMAASIGGLMLTYLNSRGRRPELDRPWARTGGLGVALFLASGVIWRGAPEHSLNVFPLFLLMMLGMFVGGFALLNIYGHGPWRETARHGERNG